MLLRFIFPVMILIANLKGYAQDDLKNARNEMTLYHYSKAMGFLQNEISKRKESPACEATLLLADCYRMLNDVANAKIWYAKAIKMWSPCRFAKNTDPIIHFRYAQALRSAGEYQEAKKVFLQYDSLMHGQQRGAVFAAYCDSAIAWQAARPEFGIMNVTRLNTPQSEFGTVYYQKGIIFSSDRISNGNATMTFGWTGNTYLKLYYSEPVIPDSMFGDFIIPHSSLNLPDQVWHNGPVSFNGDFTGIFLNQTQLYHDQGKKDPGRIRTHLLKIFSAVLTGGKWSTPKPFFLNSGDYSVGHPALSRDGKTLFFVSDMPGGYGETDIWFCRQEGGKWSAPVNLGADVNTSGKEMFPFVSGAGDLYFASDGLPGFGGLDLFVTRKTENHWGVPHNLGWPVNTSFDDFSLLISEDNYSGLFSSNRPGGAGSDDIYCFRKIQPASHKPTDSILPVSFLTRTHEKKTDAGSSPDTLTFNKIYRLENILYDFDKFIIRADAKPSLDKLISILKENPVSIELASHSDCRGSEQYNLQLSQKRAKSAVQYIISHGISASRIVARGYGKNQLLNECNCSDGHECSEIEHQYNRRTEFRIISMNGN